MHSRKRGLATIGAGETLTEASFSLDGAAVAFVVRRDHQYLVQCANGVRACYDQAQSLVVGPHGQITACRARLGDQAMVPIDGVCDRSFRWVSDPVLSADGSHVGYFGMCLDSHTPAAYATQHYYVIADNQQFGPYTGNGHLNYHLFTGVLVYSVEQHGESFVVVNGISGPRFDFVLHPAFQAGNNSVWYWARRGNSWFLLRDGIVVDESNEYAAQSGPFFGEDGRSVAYWKSFAGRWVAIHDGRVIGAVDKPIDYVNSIAIGATGEVAYAGRAGASVFVWRGDERQGPFDAVGAPTFSQDGKRLAYLARRGDRQFLVLDGAVGRDFDVIWPEEGEFADYLEDVPAFRQDGLSVAYRMRCGDLKCVVRDARPGEWFSSICGAPTFAPSGDQLVYAATRHGNDHMVINETMSEPFERIWSGARGLNMALMWSPTFSREHVVFGALSEGLLSWEEWPLDAK